MMRRRSDAVALLPALALFGALHAMLLIHDAASPDAFLSFDRAGVRLDKIRLLLAASDDRLSVLISNSAPGDYIFQVLPYLFAGRFGVILIQLLLAAIGLVFTFRLARLVLESDAAAGAAALLYVLLPGSLWVPHVLSTEAIVNPLLVVAVYYSTAWLTGSAGTLRYLVGMLMLGIAIFVRPQFILFPAVLAALGWVASAGSRRAAILAPVLGWLPLICWAGLLVAVTGSPTERTSDHGLSAVFEERIERASAIAHVPPPEAGHAVDFREFSAFAARHPAAMLKTYGSDAVNFVLNPGWSGFSNYLGWFSDYAGARWTQIRDRDGYLGLAREIAASALPFAIIMAGGTLLWAAALVLIAIEWTRVMLGRSAGARAHPVLLAFLIYTSCVVFAAGNVRWTHRTPLDFVLVALIVAGAIRSAGWVRARRWQG